MLARSFVLTLATFGSAGFLAPASAACSASAKLGDLDAAMTAAESAYGKDLAAFQAAVDQASSVLPCINEAVDPAEAARYHRMIGLGAYVARDPAAEISAFAAARSADPAYVFPESMVPAGNPLRQDYAAVDLDGDVTKPVPAPAVGEVRLDGKAGAARSSDWPVVFQLLAADGHALTTAYLLPQDPLPAFVIAPSVAVMPAERMSTAKPASHNPGRPLAIGAAAAALLAGGAYTGATLAAEDFRTNAHTDEEYGALRTRADALVITTAGLSAVATGLMIGAVVSLPW